jgi:hypothetical protein
MRRLFWTLPFIALLVAALASPANAGAPIPPDGFIKKAGGAYEGMGVTNTVEASAARPSRRRHRPAASRSSRRRPRTRG